MEDYRAQFIDIYNKNVTRPGADRLLKWLEGTDFFTAPASTKFHGAFECGLVMHSINVYNAMMQHFLMEKWCIIRQRMRYFTVQMLRETR